MGEVAAPCAIQSSVDDSVVETTVDESAHDQPPLTVLEAAQDVVSAGHSIVRLGRHQSDVLWIYDVQCMYNNKCLFYV